MDHLLQALFVQFALCVKFTQLLPQYKNCVCFSHVVQEERKFFSQQSEPTLCKAMNKVGNKSRIIMICKIVE
jgi:hypothetical protein